MRKPIIVIIVFLGILSTPPKSIAKSFYIPETNEIATVPTEQEVQSRSGKNIYLFHLLEKRLLDLKRHWPLKKVKVGTE